VAARHYAQGAAQKSLLHGGSFSCACYHLRAREPKVPEFRVEVPEIGSNGRLQPVWRVGSVLKFCLGLSRVERARIWTQGGATIDGQPAAASFIHCFPGNVVEAWYPEERSAVSPEPDTPLRILYEDEWLLAVDKPAGQLSHPARSEQSGTVANAVAARYPAPSGEAPAPVRPIHRLDRDTSGVLLFSREARAAAALARQRASGGLRRDYLALVAGHPPPSGEITFPLGADPGHRTRRVVLVSDDGEPRQVLGFEGGETRHVPGFEGADTAREGGNWQQNRTQTERKHSFEDVAFQDARTTYQVVQYGARGAVVAARLHSGRTHQLRAHMAALGHPLLGDDLYGGPATPGLARHALHAWRLRFRHPITHHDLSLRAPLPEDLRNAAHSL
jgi:23S rRNA pseudouridine1911/1915/1917 synthase